MQLYHGSNEEIKQPKIRQNLRALDFGGGFYLTSNIQQAQRWSHVVTKRRQQGSATVNCYLLDKKIFTELSVLHFNAADEDWLEFVVANRKMLPMPQQYDLVIGPVADDATLPVIDDYMDGKYTKEEAIVRLLPQNLTDQYAFLTENALTYLSFLRSE
ncbi:DUF3990 domain-containing protein [[Haemophilus] felis]|uniref:Sortase n=1 Tax=[Haemophilus] felis TaxID=123822 RepID=A0A1T0BBR5_9PAST|nr:DUF3990 domain-containing protein [[Haemophilus] felis]NBI41769.1 DUF3990 domain-containing protein [[Haemophilus] felis]NBI43827.1 DUF3990 domain-containing protein [[Haemophilus] felis]OOS07575.1 hypothetical protein B0188_00415 [[Haemophilus] felis]